MDAFLESSQELGVKDSEGDFTVDLNVALQKLQHAQLAGPGDHLLKLVQAAHQLRCKQIDFKLGRRGVCAEFEFTYNQSLSAESLGLGLTGRIKWPSVAARHIGIALRASLGTGATEVIWRLGMGHYLSLKRGKVKRKDGRVSGRVKARVEINKRTWLEGFGPRESCESHLALYNRAHFAGLSVMVDSRVVERGWRPTLIKSPGSPHYHSEGHWYSEWSSPYVLMEGYVPATEELPVIRCSTVDLRDREAVEPGLLRSQRFRRRNGVYGMDSRALGTTPTLFRAIPSELDPGVKKICDLQCGAAFMVPLHLSGPSQVVFVLDGVVSVPKSVPLGLRGLTCVVSGEGLKTDLTEFQVMEDDLYHQRVGEVQKVAEVFIERVKRHSAHYLQLSVGAFHPFGPNSVYQREIKDRLRKALT